MPGSPPMSISPPSTIPPPSTRFSSSIPVETRMVSSSGMSVTGMAAAPVPGRCLMGFGTPGPFAGSAARDSSIVFHAPQEGHCPSQREVS